MLKRVVPPEMKQMEGFFLSKKRFSDVRIIQEVIAAMEGQRKVDFQTARAFKLLLAEYTRGARRRHQRVDWEWLVNNYRG